jgi:hypothetical protein
MDPELRRQLSPNEEITLRQLTLHGRDQETMRLGDLARLQMLRLIEVNNGVWTLTALGSRWLSAAPRR